MEIGKFNLEPIDTEPFLEGLKAIGKEVMKFITGVDPIKEEGAPEE